MKTLYCWRCKNDVPMLDEQEFKSISRLNSEAIEGIKRFREKTGSALADVPKDRFYQSMRDEYQRMAGVRVESVDCILHHRITSYGPPCQRCGKVLRGPKSSKCFECGQPRDDQSNS